MSYEIAILRGDGIGPEITDEAVKVLDEVRRIVPGLDLNLTDHEAGVGLYSRTGDALPDATFQSVGAADAILLGAMGLPEVRMPDGTEVQGRIIIRLRKGLDLYAGVRPIKLYPGIRPVVDRGEAVDLVIVRESTEGLFASFEGGTEITDQVVGDTMLISRSGTERVSRYAFELAGQRQGRPSDGRSLVTCVDKANIFRSLAFFRRVFTEVAEREFPQIGYGYALIDALSLAIVQRPADYDVLVMENMFGDILSDLAAALNGGLGMAPSGDIGDDHAMFQPSHGSAPDIAGKGVANPLATILSAKMMLEWLGARHDDEAARDGARRIDAAVAAVTAAGEVTRDIGGTSSTQSVGDAVVAALPRDAGNPDGR
ncbi:isocitrate/isopropylmalate dehydrogenase family protein [Galbitalea sp. SE-J8]|uniref:isocitrate/isopropylmalate dehydrogenase family protein n=1 Tax=Galbitalea sp. SE-J8 TaxID=3054952 RepID=UPI00259C73CF|nr:isocitrate/isopropylmalate dehydrogenase family protein [Galbitalea sp. SE-J8]MDM4762979.1 isocitrate/isopropylmalate dehydrogenase family protein [Galbitalea sp. SE-J8]